jgi:hypothetical protein
MLVVEWKRICTGLKKIVGWFMVLTPPSTIFQLYRGSIFFINVMPNEIQISRMKDRDPIKRLYNGTS